VTEEYDVSGFRYRGALIRASLGETIVRSCPICGALVMDDQTATHDAWHDDTNDRLSRLEGA